MWNFTIFWNRNIPLQVFWFQVFYKTFPETQNRNFLLGFRKLEKFTSFGDRRLVESGRNYWIFLRNKEILQIFNGIVTGDHKIRLTIFLVSSILKKFSWNSKLKFSIRFSETRKIYLIWLWSPGRIRAKFLDFPMKQRNFVNFQRNCTRRP